MQSLKKILTNELMVLGLSFGLTMLALTSSSFDRAKTLDGQRHPDYHLLLGYYYETGEEVRQDYAQAVKWYRKAAEQDNSEAQYNLDVVYYSGRGVRQNKIQAKEWFGKFCDNGMQEGYDEYWDLN